MVAGGIEENSDGSFPAGSDSGDVPIPASQMPAAGGTIRYHMFKVNWIHPRKLQFSFPGNQVFFTAPKTAVVLSCHWQVLCFRAVRKKGFLVVSLKCQQFGNMSVPQVKRHLQRQQDLSLEGLARHCLIKHNLIKIFYFYELGPHSNICLKEAIVVFFSTFIYLCSFSVATVKLDKRSSMVFLLCVFVFQSDQQTMITYIRRC